MLGGWLLMVLVCCQALSSTVSTMSCEEARLKCAYRTGCGMALQNYMVGCSGLGRGPRICPEPCQHALIALASTNEGKHLMTCECRDENCRETKDRVEVCRPEVVLATQNETIVSCVVAQWICGADTLCSTALRYYHLNCKSMFQGKRCSLRCKNSINILRRQEKAAKLDRCICTGREEYDCPSMKTNMDRMCFHKKSQLPPPRPSPPPEHPPPPSAASISSYSCLLLFITFLPYYR